MAAPIAAVALQAAKTKAGKKLIKIGCLLTLFLVLLPIFLVLALLGPLINAMMATADDGCTTGLSGDDPVIAAAAMQDAGVTDTNKLILMVAIAGSESSFKPDAVNPSSNASGLWQIMPLHTQYFPPNKPKDWIFDPTNNASAAVPIAGGPGITNLHPWETDAAVKAFVAAGGTLQPAAGFDLVSSAEDSNGDFAAARQAVATLTSSGGSGGSGGSAAGGLTILGPNSLTADDIVAWWAKQSYGAPRTNPTVDIKTLAGFYISEGADEGVRGDVAFAQAVLETGGFQSSQSGNLNNFAGIGSYDTNPQPGHWGSAQLGVRAQIQLLKKVVQGNGANLSHPDISPGWGGRQTADWAGLTRNWATDPTYTDKIMSIYNAMLSSAGKSTIGGSCTEVGNASTQSIKAEADKLDALNLPYCYGGGHNGTPAVPGDPHMHPCPWGPGLDCSGAVSYVLQHAGVNVQTMVSGGFMTWGDPAQAGDPGVLIWAADGHVFMTINGVVFSSNTYSRRDGGPHWHGTNPAAAEPVEGPGPNMGYVIRHVPGTS